MEQIVKANGIDIWCETFGDVKDPAVLLIMGIGTQGVAWDDELCALLAASGRFVIRYDHRDTGRSSLIDYDANPYTLADLADDAAGLLTALGVDKAHVVGASMGGMIAQELAINHPDRTLSLTSVISTPAVLDPSTMQYSSGLPAIEQRAIDVLIEMAMSPATNRDEEIAQFLRLAHMLTGSDYEPLDEVAAARVRNLELDRAVDMSKTDNHSRAITSSQDRTERLGSVTVPTLVIHGSVDPMFPLPHGEATAKAVPGATLVVVEGMGHTPPRTKDFARMLLEHTG